MEKYFMLFADTAKKGVPPFLDGELHEQYNPKNPMPGMDYEWATILHEKVKFPPMLWLITKEKLLSFDYYPAFYQHLVSKEFKQLMDAFKIKGYSEVPLKTVSKKNEKVTGKEYSFLIFYKDYDCVDYEKSVYAKSPRGKNTDDDRVVGTRIRKYKEVVFKKEIKADLFAVKDKTFYHHLFCSQKFMEEAREQKLYGLDFVPLSNAANVYNDFYSV